MNKIGLVCMSTLLHFFLQISFGLVKMSFHVEFHLPGIIPCGRKVCVVGGGWVVVVVLKVTLVLRFGPNLELRLWILTWTKLNKNDFIFLSMIYLVSGPEYII